MIIFIIYASTMQLYDKKQLFYRLKFVQLTATPVSAALIALISQNIHKVIHRICE